MCNILSADQIVLGMIKELFVLYFIFMIMYELWNLRHFMVIHETVSTTYVLSYAYDITHVRRILPINHICHPHGAAQYLNGASAASPSQLVASQCEYFLKKVFFLI